jgi:hypothetical protein
MLKPRAKKVFRALLIAGAIFFVLLCFPVHQRTIYSCLRCRAENTEHTLLFVIPWRTQRDTEFTTCYVAHFPPHEHTWSRSSCTRGRNAFGRDILWACGRIHPVFTFPASTEREFLLAADAATIEAFFRGLESPEREVQQQTIQTAWERVLSQ